MSKVWDAEAVQPYIDAAERLSTDNHRLATILQGLIAELHEEAAVYRAHPVYAPAPKRWESMADRAEQQLKGMDDE